MNLHDSLMIAAGSLGCLAVSCISAGVLLRRGRLHAVDEPSLDEQVAQVQRDLGIGPQRDDRATPLGRQLALPDAGKAETDCTPQMLARIDEALAAGDVRAAAALVDGEPVKSEPRRRPALQGDALGIWPRRRPLDDRGNAAPREVWPPATPDGFGQARPS